MSAASLYAAGNAHYEAGRLVDAVDAYERATFVLAPSDDAWASDLYENLGLALWQVGRFVPAARALARALDGVPQSREQALRVLVSCLFRATRPLDGERWLRVYEAAFGPHPEGWQQTAAPYALRAT